MENYRRRIPVVTGVGEQNLLSYLRQLCKHGEFNSVIHVEDYSNNCMMPS